MTDATRWPWFLLLGVPFLAGCSGPWSHQDSGTVEAKKVRVFKIEAPRKDHEQRFQVTVHSSETAVDLCLVLARDEADAVKALEAGKLASKTLARPGQAKDLKVEIRLPASSQFALVVRNPSDKATTVTLQVREVR